MAIKKRSQGILEMNMTPMIDCVFLLLIFFLVSTRVADSIKEEKSLDIKLPESTQTGPVTGYEDTFIINIFKDGAISIKNQKVTEENLLVMLRDITANNPAQIIEIRGDQQTLYGRMVNIISLCLSAGINAANVQLVVTEEGENTGG